VRLHDYLRRIGDTGPLDAGFDTLRRLHAAHRETFLFENLSIQAGGGVSVTLEDIESKFIDQGRGGYCFEHNTLFAAVLRECGFETATLLGRVRRGPPQKWARTHMVLRVTARLKPRAPYTAEIAEREALAERGDDVALAERGDDVASAERGDKIASAERAERVWLADVGFGAIGLVEPIELADGVTSRQRGLAYRLRREPGLWILSMRDASGEQDLYGFSDDPQTEADVEVANHYTSTHPDSIFRRSLTIQGVRGDARTILRTGIVSRYVSGVLEESPLERSELRRRAQELFGVELPHDPMIFDSYAGKGA
jgi:N-hydroxyarylamine O-acetyltransferase